MRTVFGKMRDDGSDVDVSSLCRWLGVPRSTVYYETRQRASKPIDGFVANLIYEIIQTQPAWGVRLVWSYLRFELGFATLNVKKVARIMRREGWTERQRKAGKRPRVEHRKSIAERPDERWAIDIALVQCGQDGWCAFVLVIDCCTRQVLGWELADTAKARTAERALESALLARFGHCRAAPKDLVIRHDNGLVFGSRRYVATVTDYGLSQEYIAPYTPEQNGLCERFIRTIKEEFVWHRRFASIDEAMKLRVLLDDQMLDLDREVVVKQMGEKGERELFRGTVARSQATLDRTLSERGDPGMVFVAEVVVDWTTSP
ncbi:MAG: IS3 family transposase [Phycisphaerae bacterium]|nr:IS3 family transposase [Phycisphaerae bacterium]